MGDLQHDINALKYVQRFLKPLEKVIGVMETVEGLEKREIEMNVIISNLEKKQVVINEAVETSNKMLHERQKNVKKEMAKIDSNIQIEKDAIIRQYDIEISKRKEDSLLLQEQNKTVSLGNKKLEEEKARLEKTVRDLKKVISNANSTIPV